jgi:trans-aconitate 2-methyltransferase
MAVREWDGASYDRVSATMERMGRGVLARLDLAGDETVLDAGCGSGRVTQALIERLPRGRVIGVDQSQSMIDAARERLGPDVDLRALDLVDLELSEPVDAILSTATFHWVAEHERLFSRLHAALRPGGRLVAQCGGEGNIRALRTRAAAVSSREPYRPHLERFTAPWNYPAPELTRERLLGAGFSAADCWLTPAPAEPENPREYLRTIVLGPFVQTLPPKLVERYLDEVMRELGEPVVVDYVRLNIDAVA